MSSKQPRWLFCDTSTKPGMYLNYIMFLENTRDPPKNSKWPPKSEMCYPLSFYTRQRESMHVILGTFVEIGFKAGLPTTFGGTIPKASK